MVQTFIAELTDHDSIRVFQKTQHGGVETLAIILNDGKVVFDVLSERIIDYPHTRVITGSILGKEVTLDRGDCRNTFNFSEPISADSHENNLKGMISCLKSRIKVIREWENAYPRQIEFSIVM